LKREEMLQLLRDCPVFWSRLGFCYDPPRADAQGRQIIFNRDFARYRKLHDAFQAAGVTLHTNILHSGWIGDGQYDYTATDETLDALLKDAPDRLYIPRVKLNVPVDWCRNHPEDVLVYYGGPQTSEEIAAMVDTPLHDWFGGDGDGYPVNGGFYKDDRPNYGGMISRQSFSSAAWLRDAGEALRRLINHLENGPYGKQIIAYQIGFGMCGESTQWGAWRKPGENRRGDYGIQHRKAFTEWALQKYGSSKAVEEAWGFPVEQLAFPCPNDRESAGSTLAQMFYDDCPMMLDYNAFLSQVDADAICYFGRIVHQLSDKPVGAFYGYLMGLQSAYSGHLGIDRLLASPDVDFLCSPRSYHYCAPGEPGGQQSASRSMNRKKIWLDELDVWTHLDPRNLGDAAKNMDQSQTLLWREWAKNIVSDQNFWWMDLGDGWFDHPDIMKTLEDQQAWTTTLRRTPHRSTSEVLLVVDDESLLRMRDSACLSMGLLRRVERELKLCCASSDLFRVNDMLDMPLEQYKVIVFLNAFYMPQERWQALRSRMRKDVTLMWHYAAGILGPQYDPANVQALTGFEIKPAKSCSSFLYDDCTADFPPIRICPKATQEVLLKDEQGAVAAMEKRQDGGWTLLVTEPCLRQEHLAPLLQTWGVHRYVLDGKCTVYADNRLIGIFPMEALDCQLRLPEAAVLEELLTGQRYEADETVRLKLPAMGKRIFRILERV